MREKKIHYHPGFYIITGGPGAGKTTLLNELLKNGYSCIPEAARVIIKEQVATAGDALPWKDTVQYSQLMLNRSIDLYLATPPGIHFFDRGIADTLAYARLIHIPVTAGMEDAVSRFRCNKKVFLLPPWEEIYQTDEERKQDFAEAVRTHDVLAATYSDYGYELISVPRLSPHERAQFVSASMEKS